MNEFQTCKPGHRSQENLYVLKSMMRLSEKYNELLILQMMDLEKFFDFENLVDVLEAPLYNKVEDKEYRLIYQMNKRREVKVLTAVGESKAEIVSEGLSQGTLESAPLSASSTARGIDIFFKDSEYEIHYNNKIRIPCMSYQDDIMRSSKTLEETQAGISKLESMAESQLLTFNEKSIS